MKNCFFIVFFLFSYIMNSQTDHSLKQDTKSAKPVKAKYEQYQIITIDRDTTYIDTSLTIQSEYKHNYLRKDNFGLLPFSNEGQTYNTLDFGLNKFSPYPEFGYKAKHFDYIEANQIKYYSVATPLTELYFKTVLQQGQNTDAFITLNTSKQFNFSLAYRGLRSLGKYINQLSSSGNFRFASSYHTKTKQYILNSHFTSQDFLNGENGGITTTDDFESKNPDYLERQRLEVYFRDAKSFLKGKRIFIDHVYRINTKEGANNLYFGHQLNYETKYFEYNQVTVPSTVGTSSYNRYGDSYVTSSINDQTKYNRTYNKIWATYENSTLGKFQFYLEDFRYNYLYNKILVLSNNTIPSFLKEEITSFGGQYEYQKNNWHGKFLFSNSITNQSLSNIDANLNYKIDAENQFTFQYQKINKLPDNIYSLHQSSYVAYNWFNNFRNEKINNIMISGKTSWLDASVQVTNLNDFLYFSDDSTNAGVQLISPKQYSKTINYLSVKLSREIKFWKFGIDNTVLYQKVDQPDHILNVPQLVTRNTLYFADNLFDKSLYLQTGVSFNYFTKYYANDYNPIVAEFFVQDRKQIGDFANFDFFINARIKQTRIYFKAEHFNSGLSNTNTFYSTPNYPYRDFIVRFGLVWNFFQ